MQYHGANYAEDVWDIYWYEKNIFGDVIAVYDEYGTKLMSYVYGAYGEYGTQYFNSGATTTAVNNPFKYRGYYYDKDLNLYYLNTRYYDSSLDRFISPDSYVSTGQGILGNNMYAYCNNNPVMNVDPNGTLCKDFWNKVGVWFSNVFGAGVIETHSYEKIRLETLFFDIEEGVISSKVESGDIGKPISFYVTKPKEWWKIWEYKAGVQFNTKNGGFAYDIGFFENSVCFAQDDSFLQLTSGIDKQSYTMSYEADFDTRTAGEYLHGYVRTIPTAIAVFAIYVTKGLAAPLVARLVAG